MQETTGGTGRGKSLFHEVSITYSGQLVGSGIGFVIQLLLQRALGPADYGVLAIAVSVGSLASVLTDVGISHGMVRFGSKYLAEAPERAMPRFTAALLLRLALTALVTLIGLACARFIALHLFSKPALVQPLVWVFLGMGGTTLFSYWMFFIQTHQRFGLRSVVNIATALMRLGGFFAVKALAVLTPAAMIIVDAASALAGFLIGMSFSPRGLLAWNGPEIRRAAAELVPYCRFTGVLIIGDVIFNELDVFMLGVFETQEVVGLYRAAWTYAMVLGFLNVSVANVMFPKVTAVSDRAELRRQIRRILKFTGLLAVATLPALPIVSWWIPWYEIRYADATTIFYIMYVGLVFELVVGPLGYVLYSIERPGILVGVALIKITLNVIGNVALIPLFGAHGAAAATLLTRIIGGLIAIGVVFHSVGTRRSDGAPPDDDGRLDPH